ncbi:response regulator [Maritimibacter sp. 55A14]|uniref:response regulator n=1 Tax=Maritimibacter sp. 55A14 TaxID=2174844 RepID=UPI000D614C9A|nr:response regulator [Maritimibacter sp. 55A14]PWE33334.1 response regulator [Maritimibacter sp. 55A14]
MDDFPEFHRPRANAARPLAGLTVLLVEDSRFASEAVRLLCLASGARIRRADCLKAARRHLGTYFPAVAIVDLGLPDGSGLDLIAEMDSATPRVPVILATSGEDAASHLAIAAGADGFLAKPLAGIAGFQQAVLSRLPGAAAPAGPRPVPKGRVCPEGLTYREDLEQAARRLAGGTPRELAYTLQFLRSVAGAAGDVTLQFSTRTAEAQVQSGTPRGAALRRLRADISERLMSQASI